MAKQVDYDTEAKIDAMNLADAYLGNAGLTNYTDLYAALRELADAAEDFAGSESDMASHKDTENRFDKALERAREVLKPAA